MSIPKNNCKKYDPVYRNIDYGVCLNTNCDNRSTCEVSSAGRRKLFVNGKCIEAVPLIGEEDVFCANKACIFKFICQRSSNVYEPPRVP